MGRGFGARGPRAGVAASHSDINRVRGPIRDRMMLDDRLTATDFRVGCFLLDKTNREEFENYGHLRAWPGQEKIGDAVGCSPDAVRKATKRLETCGYLRIERGRGRGHFTVYYFPVPNVSVDGESPTNLTDSDRKPRQSPSKNPDTDLTKTRTDPATNSLNYPSDETCPPHRPLLGEVRSGGPKYLPEPLFVVGDRVRHNRLGRTGTVVQVEDDASRRSAPYVTVDFGDGPEPPILAGGLSLVRSARQRQSPHPGAGEGGE